MAGILKLKQLLDRTKRLPIVGQLSTLAADAGVRSLVESPERERAAAIAGLVPKRCGLCKHFNLEAAQREMQANAHWTQAADFLGPEGMGVKSTEQIEPRGSEAARALRPFLHEKFEDYGLCTRWKTIAFWAFEEQPPAPGPDDAPCQEWT